MAGNINNAFMCLQNDVRNHCIRTSIYSRIIAEHTDRFYNKYNKQQLPNMVGAVMDGGMYHDIGKVLISDYLLHKKEKLREHELEILHQHPQLSEQIIIRDMDFSGCDEQYRSIVINMAKYHHEHFDGHGYETGLSGEAIPIEARICSVANAFDAIMSRRGHKKAFRFGEAVKFIDEQSGKMFDPYIVDCFHSALPEIEDAECLSKRASSFLN